MKKNNILLMAVIFSVTLFAGSSFKPRYTKFDQERRFNFQYDDNGQKIKVIPEKYDSRSENWIVDKSVAGSSSKEKPRDYQDKILHAWRNQYIKGIKGESNGRAQDVQSDFRRARKNLNNFARKWGALNDLYYSVREALPLKKAELVRAYENGEISELEKQIKEKEIAKLEDWKLKKEAKLMGSVHSQKDGKPGVYESETYRLLDDRVRKKDDLLKQENDFYQQAARLNDQGKYINSDHFASSHFDHSYYANAPIEEDLLKQKEIKELNDWGQKWDLAGWGKQWDDARIAKENDDLKDTLGAWGKTLGYEG